MLKRAQFFLLAAVIISAVVLSLGITANWARMSHEPRGFYDFSYEVKRETSAVADYDIYNNIVGGELEDFVNLLAEDIKERDPDSEFLFIYGDNSSMTLKNYGAESTMVGGEEISGAKAKVKSRICIKGSCEEVVISADEFDEGIGTKVYEDLDDITVEVEGYPFSFPISEYKQVIFIMQKDVEDESFITVE